MLPAHLKTLARVHGEVTVDVTTPVSATSVIDALEETYPGLRGTIRDPATRQRRVFVRFFVGESDISHEPIDAALPEEVAAGREVFYVIGAMAGG